jgi:hypothetical protein
LSTMSIAIMKVSLIASGLCPGAFLVEGFALGLERSPDEKDASGRKPEAIIYNLSGECSSAFI